MSHHMILAMSNIGIKEPQFIMHEEPKPLFHYLFKEWERPYISNKTF